MEEVGKALIRIEGLIVGLDKKLDHRFMWMLGLQFAILIAIIVGFLRLV